MKFDPGEIRNLAQIFNNKTLVTKKNFFCNLFWFSLFFLQEHKTEIGFLQNKDILSKFKFACNI